MKISHFALLGLLISLAACGQLIGNDQGSSGISKVHMAFDTGPDGTPVLSGVDWIDGKEKASVSLNASIKDGSLNYTATDVLAFDGARVRGEVEKALAEAQVEVAPSAINVILEAVKRTLGVP